MSDTLGLTQGLTHRCAGGDGQGNVERFLEDLWKTKAHQPQAGSK